MQFETLQDFRNSLREAIKSQDMDKFGDLVCHCPFVKFIKSPRPLSGIGPCPECPLSDKDGSGELFGNESTCLVGSMKRIYADYSLYKETGKEATMARLILESTKLLAYLDSKE